jgi:hypothetical protein
MQKTKCLRTLVLSLALSLMACCPTRAVIHDVKIKHVPCLDEAPPVAPKIQGSRCPEGLEYCLQKDDAWKLALYLEATITWMSGAWALCKENKDGEEGREETGEAGL